MDSGFEKLIFVKLTFGMKIAQYFMMKWCIFLLSGFVILPLWANNAPVVDSFTGDPPSVLPGGTVILTVQAHDPDCPDLCTTGCGQTIRADLTQWSNNGGTFVSIDNGSTESPYTASAIWQAPSTEGLYTITVTLSDSGTWMCGGRQTTSQSLPIQVTNNPNQPPIITNLWADKEILQVGEITQVHGEAYDPDGDPIAYQWSVTAGSITDMGDGLASYQAPLTPGMVTITFTVTDDQGGQATDTLTLSITEVQGENLLLSGFWEPRRVAGDRLGYLFIADPRMDGISVIQITSEKPVAFLPLPSPTAVAVDWANRLLVGSSGGAQVWERDGTPLYFLSPPGEGLKVTDVAVDAFHQRYLVLYGEAGKVSVYDDQGSYLFSFGSIGDNPGEVKGAMAIAVGPDGSIYIGDRGHGKVHQYDPTGQYLTSFGQRGDQLGEFTQLADVAVSTSGILYVTDSYQSHVQAFNPDGSLREVFGGVGHELGELMSPGNIAFIPELEKLVVASTAFPAIQLFTLPSAQQPIGNTPPTSPTPISPANGETLPKGTPVILTVENAYDPDYQPLQYRFDLYLHQNTGDKWINTWVVEEGNPTTSVDVTPWIKKFGEYRWKAQAYDGLAYSPPSQVFTFTMATGPKNEPPSSPIPYAPINNTETSTLTPTLQVYNASDPEGDPLTYTFEVLLPQGDTYQTAVVSPGIPEDPSGITSWMVPSGVLLPSQQVVWLVKAEDPYGGYQWSDKASFWTYPFDLPMMDAMGHLPEGDKTHPRELRFRMGPKDTDITLYYQGYDITAVGEVSVYVNKTWLFDLPALEENSWSFTQLLRIPADLLSPNQTNPITFIHKGTDFWGLRKVTLEPPPVPLIYAIPYNTVIDIHWEVSNFPEGGMLRLYRAYSPDGPFTKVGDFSPYQTPYRDIGLTNQTPYYYKATFVDNEGLEGLFSEVLQAVPSDTLGTTPITDLKLHKEGDDLLLEWTFITSQPSLTGVELYAGPFGDWQEDTQGFTNLINNLSPTQKRYRLIQELLNPQATWYSLIPVDVNNQRANP